MLSAVENELVVRTGRGTPMGELFRRFWTPVMLAEELGTPDAPPVRVRVLGENLVAFRDTGGRIGLLDRYCPHRRANLFWGRNEEGGLRCIYHGWKFDTGGQCVDMPNCPEGSTLKSRVRTRAYPALERGGIVWAYLGPPELKPPFPNIEILNLPAEQRHVCKIEYAANYLQLQEGDMDSSHTSFLHSKRDKKAFPGSLPLPIVFADPTPRWVIKETEYGLMLASQRDAGDGWYQYRIGQYLMPYVVLIAVVRGTRMLANIRVPVDDEHSILFRVFAQPERPLDDEDFGVIFGGVMAPEMIPGTFTMKENRANDYLIDRDVQRNETFSGIKSIVAQDAAVTEEQGDGPFADRSQEYLVSSDRAIIALRKKLIGRAKALREGNEPPEASNPQAYAVRAVDCFLPHDVPVEEGAKELVAAV